MSLPLPIPFRQTSYHYQHAPRTLACRLGSDTDLNWVSSKIDAVKLEVDLKKSEFDGILNLAQELSKTGHQTTLVKSANELLIRYQVGPSLASVFYM